MSDKVVDEGELLMDDQTRVMEKDGVDVEVKGHEEGKDVEASVVTKITPAAPPSTGSSAKPSGRNRKGRKRESSTPDPTNVTNGVDRGRSSSPRGSVTSSTATTKTGGSVRSRRSRSARSPESSLGSLFSVASSKKKDTKNRTKQHKVKVMSTIGNEEEMKVMEDTGKAEDDEYIVEGIVGKKMIITDNGRKLHYHIKWKGWATPHNTWEPLENLEGCLELVDAYEAERTRRRNRGLDSDPEADDDDPVPLPELEHMDRTRKELVEIGVETRWPTELIPLNLVGVVTIDKQLCYIVRHQVKKYVPSLSADNTVIVKAEGFRNLFPRIVITFYENCILWVNRAESKDDLEFKARRAVEISKLVKGAESLLENQRMRPPVVEEEVELDEDGLPLPKIDIKKGIDLYGLPLRREESSSSSEDEYVEKPIPNPYPVLAQRNQ